MSRNTNVPLDFLVGRISKAEPPSERTPIRYEHDHENDISKAQVCDTSTTDNTEFGIGSTRPRYLHYKQYTRRIWYWKHTIAIRQLRRGHARIWYRKHTIAIRQLRRGYARIWYRKHTIAILQLQRRHTRIWYRKQNITIPQLL